jgi:tripartite ATP-independent transporter DctP family solute receptor
MTQPIQIRMAGYGPPTTGFSKALKLMGDKLAAQFGDRVDIKYVWNIMDFGYKAEDILWLAENGVLTLVYQSSSYLTDRVPELSVVDLPFLFADTAHARGAMDGALGRRLIQAIESKCNYRVLGWYENGFRHISNRVRTVRMPADLTGIKIRVLPSKVQERTFELLGATPMIMDLTDAIRMIKAGEIDAQENPLTNTVTYGVYKFHRFHTISNHFYISRPILLHRPTFDGWPSDLKEALQRAVGESVVFQRALHLQEEAESEQAIRAEGGEIVTLDQKQHDAFAAAVQPIYAEAKQQLGAELFKLVSDSAANSLPSPLAGDGGSRGSDSGARSG